jgi:hypothetical protein
VRRGKINLSLGELKNLLLAGAEKRAFGNALIVVEIHSRIDQFLAGVTRQSAFRCGSPLSLSFRVLKRTTAPGTRLRVLIRLRPVPVNT